jgi:hypothetical protein
VTVLLIWVVERMVLALAVVEAAAAEVDVVAAAVEVEETTTDEELDAAASILKWLDHWKVLSSLPSRVIWIP